MLHNSSFFRGMSRPWLCNRSDDFDLGTIGSFSEELWFCVYEGSLSVEKDFGIEGIIGLSLSSNGIVFPRMALSGRLGFLPVKVFRLLALVPSSIAFPLTFLRTSTSLNKIGTGGISSEIRPFLKPSLVGLGDVERDELIHDLRAKVDKELDTDRVVASRPGLRFRFEDFGGFADRSFSDCSVTANLDTVILELWPSRADFRLITPLISAPPRIALESLAEKG